MRRIFLSAMSAMVVAGGASALTGFGQMHKVEAAEPVVRAVSVYEWIGERSKPTASRLIPVTLFIDGSFEDAGVYLARPIPMALESGTIYEVAHAGVPEGTVNVSYVSHLRAVDPANSYDDGWFGYGKFAPPPAPKKVAALRESKSTAGIVSSKPDTAKGESDRPTFSHKAGASSGKTDTTDKPAASSKDDDKTPSPASDDPDRPHLTRKPDSTASDSADSANKPADNKSSGSSDSTPASDDPDRPHLTKKPESGTGPAPADDPDRPTLKKRSPEETKKARKEAEQSSATGLATSLNDDPSRPTLHHGKGEQGFAESDFPKLKGLPPNLHQAAAVSDAKTRPVHDFSRAWTDETERTGILTKMQVLARAQLAAYRVSYPVAAAAKPEPTKAVAKRPASSTANSKIRQKKPASAAPAEPLFDERLDAYTLSYGGAETYVYTARTDGEGATLDYVTIVAQMDALGELKPAIQNVTDATHLDRTPWMRLVDVVDAEASNRASLLFELRGETTRQFALYRVIATRSEQTFLTGTTQ